MTAKLPVIVQSTDLYADPQTNSKDMFGFSKHSGQQSDENIHKSLDQYDSVKGGFFEVRNFDVDKLQDELRSFCQSLSLMLKDIQAVGAYKLSEVTVAAEISAEGGFQLIGTSKVGGKGSIELKFTSK